MYCVGMLSIDSIEHDEKSWGVFGGTVEFVSLIVVNVK